MSKKYMNIVEAANRWDVSQNDVAEACIEGIVEEAFKDEKGTWQIPKNAKNPFADTEPTESEKKKENIIIAVISGILIVTLFVSVGFNNIKLWLFSLLVNSIILKNSSLFSIINT